MEISAGRHAPRRVSLLEGLGREKTANGVSGGADAGYFYQGSFVIRCHREFQFVLDI